jgi:hypothetical protein
MQVKSTFGQPEPLEQAALPGAGRGRAERPESLAGHWPGPWVWRLCFSCGGSSPRRKMRFEEQPLWMNIIDRDNGSFVITERFFRLWDSVGAIGMSISNYRCAKTPHSALRIQTLALIFAAVLCWKV